MENNQLPELVLDMAETPALTLTPTTQPSSVPGSELPSVPEQNTEQLLRSNLSEKEKALVHEFAQKIDISDTAQIIQFGGAAQKKVSDFAQNALESVRTKDVGEAGKMITGLVVQLKDFSTTDEKKGLFGIFNSAKNRIKTLQTQYATVEKNVDKICGTLESHKIILLKDIAVLDKMYDMNLSYYKEVTMYILAGKERLQTALSQELPALQEKARSSGLPDDAQAANDFSDKCNRFDKKLYDLELTRQICIQMAPQIRLIQNNNSLMAEKIQSSLVNTIPLWKSQMVIALGLANTQNALQAQREVTNLTNDLLRKNADALKMGTIEVAKEAERGIVDIETLTHTNQSLISTLDEVMQIQEDGRNKRRFAETELARMENELKVKLLQPRSL